jgi:hypothetical protein
MRKTNKINPKTLLSRRRVIFSDSKDFKTSRISFVSAWYGTGSRAISDISGSVVESCLLDFLSRTKGSASSNIKMFPDWKLPFSSK